MYINSKLGYPLPNWLIVYLLNKNTGSELDILRQRSPTTFHLKWNQTNCRKYIAITIDPHVAQVCTIFILFQNYWKKLNMINEKLQ